jgi:hypothetical protein
VEAFVHSKDPRSYEKLVERLLASPRYGERMASYWLDLVRYGDTVGYHGDCDYSVWPYRDYVIKAFNENYSFARFTREQLAGDLLPGATREQRVASGYNRLNRVSTEGGVQDKEYLAKYASDRVPQPPPSGWGHLGCAGVDHNLTRSQARFYRFSAFSPTSKRKGFTTKVSPKTTGARGRLAQCGAGKTLRSLTQLAEEARRRHRHRTGESRVRWKTSDDLVKLERWVINVMPLSLN